MDATTASIAVAAFAAIFAYYRTRENQKELTRLQAYLNRIEALQASRSVGYGKIWKLTKGLNLFGSHDEVPVVVELCNDLKDWYFEFGWALSRESKHRYFLIQECLHFIDLKELTLTRPLDDNLFGEEERPVSKLRDLREREMGIPKIGEEQVYSSLQLSGFVGDWKKAALIASSPDDDNRPWLLLQLLLSNLRSQIVRELGSRNTIEKALS